MRRGIRCCAGRSAMRSVVSVSAWVGRVGVGTTARRGWHRAIPSRSWVGRCPSPTWRIRPRPTSRSGPRWPPTTTRSTPTSPRRARPACWPRTAEEAWGNAAIAGFGIGRPVREPELDRRSPAAARRPGGGGRADGAAVRDRARDARAGQRARTCRCSSPTACPTSRPIGTRIASSSGCSERSWRSSVPWRSR